MKIVMNTIIFKLSQVAIVILLCGLFSCNNKEDVDGMPDTTLDVESTKVEFSPTGESKVVEIKTNSSEWNATRPEADGWCSLSLSDKILTIKTEPNTTDAARTTKITVTAGKSTPIVIDVLQKAKGAAVPSSFGLMHITADSYNADNFMLMMQDDEPLTVLYNDPERVFQINKPLQVTVNEKNQLQVKFFAVRPVLNVQIYAQTVDHLDWFKLATYDSIAGFQLSKTPLPVVDSGTSVVLESGATKILTSDYHFSTTDALKIICEDPLYKKIATNNKCEWVLQFYGGTEAGVFDKEILPVHAREAVALLSNMSYMFSQKIFEDGLQSLQGRLYGDGGVGDWIDTKELYQKLTGYIEPLVKLSTPMGAAGRYIFALSEFIWFAHYHDTTDGDATITPFHEFAHCLRYDHTSNMTRGATGSDRELFPIFCHDLYKEMCIKEELPVWSCNYLKSKYNKHCYFYDSHIRP